jgi:16S rRNA C967 or C1407 C5-methylase (RsmB/RsmF family)/NOL1/NOP2/fmu family ribosome biogenesis protein
LPLQLSLSNLTMHLPEPFLKSAKQFVGEQFDAFIKSLDDVAPVSIRLNPFKQAESFSKSEKILWSEEGRYLEQRPSFTNDPLFHAGCYYVQDASSQFLEQAFMEAKEVINGPLRILDLCAAPGGKSTHMLSLIDKEDLLVSNEIISSRNNILRQNIMKWGVANVIVTQNKPEDFRRMENYFDIVIIDAPCSGEGLFRKDPDAVSEWSEENVNRCAVRQKEILEHSWTCLRAGGMLIYCTCTFEEVENDVQVKEIIARENAEIIFTEKIFSGIIKTSAGYSFYPHLIRGEGFFISMIKKNGESKRPKYSFKNSIVKHKLLDNLLLNATNFSSLEKDERLFAIPVVHTGNFNFINERLYVRHAGIPCGEMKGRDFIPSEALALSIHLNKENKAELDIEQSIQYLKGNDPLIKSDKGWTLATHKNFGLGWMKNVGTRINNYYPKEWRIRY